MNKMTKFTNTPKKNNVSVRKKAFYALLFIFFSVFGSIGLIININSKFFMLAIVPAYCGGLYLLSLRCPSCGNRIYKRKAKVSGETVTYWGGFGIPTHCAHCNTKL
ncbi:MAG: hypothetical protein ABSB19_14340 [Methylomonas sp.]|jgi:hypothetical protein